MSEFETTIGQAKVMAGTQDEIESQSQRYLECEVDNRMDTFYAFLTDMQALLEPRFGGYKASHLSTSIGLQLQGIVETYHGIRVRASETYQQLLSEEQRMHFEKAKTKIATVIEPAVAKATKIITAPVQKSFAKKAEAMQAQTVKALEEVTADINGQLEKALTKQEKLALEQVLVTSIENAAKVTESVEHIQATLAEVFESKAVRALNRILVTLDPQEISTLSSENEMRNSAIRTTYELFAGITSLIFTEQSVQELVTQGLTQSYLAGIFQESTDLMIEAASINAGSTRRELIDLLDSQIPEAKGGLRDRLAHRRLVQQRKAQIEHLRKDFQYWEGQIQDLLIRKQKSNDLTQEIFGTQLIARLEQVLQEAGIDEAARNQLTDMVRTLPEILRAVSHEILLRIGRPILGIPVASGWGSLGLIPGTIPFMPPSGGQPEQAGISARGYWPEVLIGWINNHLGEITIGNRTYGKPWLKAFNQQLSIFEPIRISSPGDVLVTLAFKCLLVAPVLYTSYLLAGYEPARVPNIQWWEMEIGAILTAIFGSSMSIFNFSSWGFVQKSQLFAAIPELFKQMIGEMTTVYKTVSGHHTSAWMHENAEKAPYAPRAGVIILTQEELNYLTSIGFIPEDPYIAHIRTNSGENRIALFMRWHNSKRNTWASPAIRNAGFMALPASQREIDLHSETQILESTSDPFSTQRARLIPYTDSNLNKKFKTQIPTLNLPGIGSKDLYLYQDMLDVMILRADLPQNPTKQQQKGGVYKQGYGPLMWKALPAYTLLGSTIASGLALAIPGLPLLTFASIGAAAFVTEFLILKYFKNTNPKSNFVVVDGDLGEGLHYAQRLMGTRIDRKGKPGSVGKKPLQYLAHQLVTDQIGLDNLFINLIANLGLGLHDLVGIDSGPTYHILRSIIAFNSVHGFIIKTLFGRMKTLVGPMTGGADAPPIAPLDPTHAVDFGGVEHNFVEKQIGQNETGFLNSVVKIKNFGDAKLGDTLLVDMDGCTVNQRTLEETCRAYLCQTSAGTPLAECLNDLEALRKAQVPFAWSAP